MGAITPINQLQFRSSAELFSRIKKFLSSFDAAGQIDEGDFYHYVKDTLSEVGIYCYQEQEAILMVKDYKATLPENFYQLYAAYRCYQHIENPLDGAHNCLQEQYAGGDNNCNPCSIQCNKDNDSFSITATAHFSGKSINTRFYSPTLLRLSSHVKPKFLSGACQNFVSTAKEEITIDDGIIYLNFTAAVVYMQYYGFPADTITGLPLIPDDTHIEKALEYYIMFKTLETLWLNNQAPDIETRVKYLNALYDFHLAKAKYNAKLPSFQTMTAHIRERRGRFDIYNRLTDSVNGWIRR